MVKTTPASMLATEAVAALRDAVPGHASPHEGEEALSQARESATLASTPAPAFGWPRCTVDVSELAEGSCEPGWGKLTRTDGIACLR